MLPLEADCDGNDSGGGGGGGGAGGAGDGGATDEPWSCDDDTDEAELVDVARP